MESVNIVLNSKNYETVLNRIDFIDGLLLKLMLGRELMYSYLIDVDIGCNRYLQTYPDRKVDNEAKLLLDNIDKAQIVKDEVYCVSIYNCLGRNFFELNEAMKTMKLESAKEKREQKFMELLIKVKDKLNKRCNNSPSFSKVINEINTIENIVRTKDYSNTTFKRNSGVQI
jgi:hypothetical protein